MGPCTGKPNLKEIRSAFFVLGVPMQNQWPAARALGAELSIRMGLRINCDKWVQAAFGTSGERGACNADAANGEGSDIRATSTR